MKRNCTKYISGILGCLVTSTIVYSAFQEHHPEHLPHQEYPATPIRTITTVSGTLSGASGTLGYIFQN